jgi:hypothetical protein
MFSPEVVSPETLAAAAGALLSLLFSFAPGLKERYEALPSDLKRLVMLAALVVCALASFGLACGLPESAYAAQCSQAGALEMARAVLGALMSAAVANQATYALTPRGD